MREATGHQRMEAVWLERAQRLSQRPAPAGAGRDTFPVVVLRIGEERYGIDLPDVVEVLPPVRATRVPGTAAIFAGVINVHGEIRPVIDLRRLLSIEASRSGDLTRVILLRKYGREIGLQIDAVDHIRSVGCGDVQSAGNGNAAWSPHIRGSTKDLLMLLNTDALLAELGMTT